MLMKTLNRRILLHVFRNILYDYNSDKNILFINIVAKIRYFHRFLEISVFSSFSIGVLTKIHKSLML